MQRGAADSLPPVPYVVSTLPHLLQHSNDATAAADDPTYPIDRKMPSMNGHPVWCHLQYNPRPILPQLRHPLWSPSPHVQLRALRLVPDPRHSDRRTTETDVRSVKSHASSFARSVLSVGSSPDVPLRASDCSIPALSCTRGGTPSCGDAEPIAARVLSLFPAAETFDASYHSIRWPRVPTQEGSPRRTREWAGLVPFLLREECVAREAIVEAERFEALRRLPMPPHAAHTPHPALQAASVEFTILEEIHRRYIAEEEATCVAELNEWRVFDHRCVAVGVAPLERIVHRWILRFRGRQERKAAARSALFEREFESRCEVMAEWMCEQQELLLCIVIAMEAEFRREIVALQLHVHYATGVRCILLEERVELFPKLFGCVMPMAIVCGRISGLTLFKKLDLERQHEYDALLRWDEAERWGITYFFLRDKLELFEEVHARRVLLKHEGNMWVELQHCVFAMRQERERREIEIVEACERDLDVMRWIEAEIIRRRIYRLKTPRELFMEQMGSVTLEASTSSNSEGSLCVPLLYGHVEEMERDESEIEEEEHSEEEEKEWENKE